MKTVILDAYALNPGDLSWDSLSAFSELTVYDRVRNDHNEIVKAIGDSEIVLTNKTPVDKAVLDSCPGIKYVGVLATGYDIVDVDACASKGIPVTNIPSYGTDSVAQHTIALLLELSNHVWAHSQAVKKGEWKKRGDFCFWDYPLLELSGKKMGLIGLGNIGNKVALIADALGMDVIAFDPLIYERYVGSSTVVSLDKVLRESDVISLHCPLNENNREFINKDTIAMMKKGCIIINTSRGALINENDLAAALREGYLSGAAIDVVTQEPVNNDNPLLELENCIVTPHIAWAPIESRTRLLNIAVENIKSFLNGEDQNVVNKV